MDELSTLAGYLIDRGLTITTAESCTGGLIAGRLVDYPGISKVFSEGYVTYCDDAKCRLLGVDPQIIADYGVVSHEVAQAMAVGAAKGKIQRWRS
ncbi:MAG: nicotinamide-nucleotide amidohydrolase family protein [Lachnospiraceae bacterium]|nr:nicotinamide-nucleotide amidohydrolase family protein [Lachnospiraceae bacterium]